MISLDDYASAVRRYAEAVTGHGDQLELYIDGLVGDPDAENCVSLRAMVSTQEEMTLRRGYLEIGYFQRAAADRRLAWWLFYFDIAHEFENLSLEGSCELYSKVHPLFQGTPSLFAKIRRTIPANGKSSGVPDLELIDEKAIQPIEESELVALNPGYGQLVASLHRTIPALARQLYPDAPRFVRLDPHFWSANQPFMRLEEVAIAPADPTWMAQLSLPPRTDTFAAYLLEDCDPKANMAQYRDYHVRGIRKLEVVATRRREDYLSMMIEELPRDDAPNGLMVGRCIHLDTHARSGTSKGDARLAHLDLAINVYRGVDRAARIANTLQHGKAQDATYRTHLYRIEDVPFPALFVFAALFLKSRTLLGEWLDDLNLPRPPMV